MLHYSFKKEKKVIVILKNGEKIIDKFCDSSRKNLILENHTIEWKRIRSTTLYKNGYCKNDGE